MLDNLTWGPLTTEQAAFLQNCEFWFVVCFGLTLYFCVQGDDDVVYKFMDRRPTGQEAIARIRFVLAKLFASLSGGALMVAVLGKVVLKSIFSITISENSGVLLGLLCILIASMLIGEYHTLPSGPPAKTVNRYGHLET
jgi:hypothetical protein